MKDMKIIALEEHFRNAAIEEAVKKALPPTGFLCRVHGIVWTTGAGGFGNISFKAHGCNGHDEFVLISG